MNVIVDTSVWSLALGRYSPDEASKSIDKQVGLGSVTT